MILINTENLTGYGHRTFEEDFVCTKVIDSSITGTGYDNFGNVLATRVSGYDTYYTLDTTPQYDGDNHPGNLSVYNGETPVPFLLQLGSGQNITIQDIEEMTFILRFNKNFAEPESMTSYSGIAGWVQDPTTPYYSGPGQYDVGITFNYYPYGNGQLDVSYVGQLAFGQYYSITMKRNGYYWDYYLGNQYTGSSPLINNGATFSQGGVVIKGSADTVNYTILNIDYMGVKTKSYRTRSVNI